MYTRMRSERPSTVTSAKKSVSDRYCRMTKGNTWLQQLHAGVTSSFLQGAASHMKWRNSEKKHIFLVLLSSVYLMILILYLPHAQWVEHGTRLHVIRLAFTTFLRRCHRDSESWVLLNLMQRRRQTISDRFVLGCNDCETNLISGKSTSATRQQTSISYPSMTR